MSGITLSIALTVVPSPGVTPEELGRAHAAIESAVGHAQRALLASRPEAPDTLRALAETFVQVNINESLRGSLLYDWAERFQAVLQDKGAS